VVKRQKGDRRGQRAASQTHVVSTAVELKWLCNPDRDVSPSPPSGCATGLEAFVRRVEDSRCFEQERPGILDEQWSRRPLCGCLAAGCYKLALCHLPRPHEQVPAPHSTFVSCIDLLLIICTVQYIPLPRSVYHTVYHIIYLLSYPPPVAPSLARYQRYIHLSLRGHV
jgi:hypothetical protein